MYSYRRALLDNTTGKKIGVIYIDAYQNSEMEVRVKITSRLNNKGRMVSIKVDWIYP
jgi:flavorubredoxin